MKCPKCGSENVIVQREQVSSKSSTTYGLVRNGNHGILWWLCIGWWWVIYKALIKLIISISSLGLIRFKKGGTYTGKANTDTKIKTKTVAVCQECGKTWNV